MNRSSKAQRARINWPNASFHFTELTDPYHENAVVENSAVHQDSNLEITVQPGAIVTLSTVPLKKLPLDFTVPA